MTDVPTFLSALAPLPVADFAEFGEISVRKADRMQMLTANFLGRNWVTIPHVTHNDEADITVLEAWRAEWNDANPESRLTPVVFLAKALALALEAFPAFCVSLDPVNQQIVEKHYRHVGIAVDTPRGLVVPVIRDVDKKGLKEIAAELRALSEKARSKGLSLSEMSGSCITLSSLGHIGGTSFTPIINAPDVSILGVTQARPVPFPTEEGGIEWRRMLPLSFSYDHRVINGADAARFVRFVADLLGQPDRLAAQGTRHEPSDGI
ncbi:hypothetical protein A0J57_03935 [Sphingobium sp. 22B]|uniref:2-oxo acid dehydrogenase subunit E2 n=1 Tax=unclassified Sphingobium TaxID=2611147 RepID=UPI0007833C93|nr:MULTISPECIES: 2-oxo acid dehydrogenase subunit E2 [unclassified Sphingobium]KXU33799.1 hypothetical protein AXW74_00485 [Sphingobium sp. AM]KYC33744.1 hypothetical protein A0J57_03935 [Sphingobium sp. 22B]OAP33483.1 hypothetical protein A8O16_03155 [Sphingobium sp. 20006FA]